MSVEAFVISELVVEGSVKKAYQAGITKEDFDICDEEFEWLEVQAEKRQPITVRRFKKKFPDFEFIRSDERIQDLIEELKQERAYISVRSALDETEQDLDHENAVDKANTLREILGEVIRVHSPASDTLIKSEWRRHLDDQKRISILRDAGETVGIPTKIQNLDFHWGGLQPSHLYLILGRPGDAKSFFQAKLAVSAVLDGRRVGFFSPEMNERAHRCRFSTLLSAEEDIQRACGLKNAFRNRALMDGQGYNLKTYKRFLEYVETLPGEICLFTQKYRRKKMTAAYIESRIEDLGLEIIFIDPIYKLRAPSKRQLKHEEIQDLVDSVQELAQGYNIPAVISNQATRGLIGTKGEPPSKDTSFGSDAPVQEADTVIGVKHFSEERLMKLRCSKNRYGDPFNFDMAFWPNVGKMEDVTPIKGEYWNGYDPEKAEELRSEIRKVEKEVEKNA
jgi:DnaB-like helicase C terminal domain